MADATARVKASKALARLIIGIVPPRFESSVRASISYPAGAHNPAVDARRHRLYRRNARVPAASSMKNGLYSIHLHMLDGVKGRDSGVIILRDGVLLGGGPYFWSVGSYTVGNGIWKGDLVTNQHTRFPDPLIRPLFAGQEVATGFSGRFADDKSEVFGTTLAGRRSLSFKASLKKLADS